MGKYINKNYAKGWGDTRENTPGVDILTSGKETVPNMLWVVGAEAGGREVPLWDILAS